MDCSISQKSYIRKNMCIHNLKKITNAEYNINLIEKIKIKIGHSNVDN